MRKTIFILAIVMLLSFAYAINLDLQIKPQKLEYTNEETVVFDVNVVNYDVFEAAKDTKLYIKIDDLNVIKEMGTISPDQITTTTFDIGKLEASTYSAEAFLEYEFLGIKDTTQREYVSFKVVPATPIVMETYKAIIKDVKMPDTLIVNGNARVEIQIQNNANKLLIEYAIGDEKYDETITEKGLITIEKNFSLKQDGATILTITLYSVVDSVKFLEDFKLYTLAVANPKDYEKITPVELKIEKGNVEIEVGKPPKNIIEQVGCFIVGGCKGDLERPIIRLESSYQKNNKYYVKISVDDSKTGNSKIKECKARIYAEWIEMSAEDGAFDSAVENATATTEYSDKPTHPPEFICTDDSGNGAYFVSEVCEGGYFDGTKCVKYECTKDADCKEYQTCDQQLNKCVERSDCVEIINNGDSSTKVDLLFIGDGYDNYKELQSDVLRLVDYDGTQNGLMSVEPFNTNKQKFNVWMIKAPDYKHEKTGDSWCLKEEIAPAEPPARFEAKCPAKDNTIVISKSNFRSYASFSGTSFNSLSCYSTDTQGRLILHEFGHSFGKLMDEYTEEGKRSYPNQPNCAPNESTASSWWGDLTQQYSFVGYFPGCSYTENNIRPTENSIMRTHTDLSVDYGPVNERQLRKILEGYNR